MPTMKPIHSDGQSVHHTNSACPEAKRIKTAHRRIGTGGKPLCKACADLSRKES